MCKNGKISLRSDQTSKNDPQENQTTYKWYHMWQSIVFPVWIGNKVSIDALEDPPFPRTIKGVKYQTGNQKCCRKNEIKLQDRDRKKDRIYRKMTRALCKDNAPVSNAQSVQQFIVNKRLAVFENNTHSSDPNPCGLSFPENEQLPWGEHIPNLWKRQKQKR